MRTAVYAKYMLTHGSAHASSPEPVHRIIAVHDMHNAIEWLLSALWTYYYGAGNIPYGFKAVYKDVADKQPLILKRELELFNEERNRAQHHVIPPAPEALAKYAAYCDSFFRETLRKVSPPLEYDDLQMGALVPDVTFRLVTTPELGSHLERIGARQERTEDAESKEEQPCYVLSLRSLMILAEKSLPLAIEEGDGQGHAISNAMILLASALALAQRAAIDVLRRAASPKGLYTVEGSLVPESALGIDYGLLRVLVGEANVGFLGSSLPIPGLGLLPLGETAPATLPASDLGLGFRHEDLVSVSEGSGFSMEQSLLLCELREELIGTLQNALEKLALGIDTKDLWRFERLFETVRNHDPGSADPKSLPISGTELLWCHDFVLNTILGLAPVLSDTPDRSLALEFDKEHGLTEYYDQSEETEFPF